MTEIRTIGQIELNIDYQSITTYNDILAGMPAIKTLSIKNISQLPLDNCKVVISGYCLPESAREIPPVAPDATITVDTAKVIPSIEILQELTDDVYTEFSISVLSNEKICAHTKFPLTIQGLSALFGNNNPADDDKIHGCIFSPIKSTRIQGWERNLLDLTLRNSMLNIKIGKNISAIDSGDMDAVIEGLHNGTLDSMIVRQEKRKYAKKEPAIFKFRPPVKTTSGENAAREKDIYEQLKTLERTARMTLEENGANSLFVTIGALEWHDGNDTRARIAPLLFIPVSLVHKKTIGYEVKHLGEEPMVNVALIEMLRQMFGIELDELDSVPVNRDGEPDWVKLFEIFSPIVTDVNKRQKPGCRWKLMLKAYLGIFSFTKFLLWNDIHNHPDVLIQHPILRGLIEDKYIPDDSLPEAEAGNIESDPPAGMILPIDYDSSQLEAVAESHAGRSFVLHGPPGTGKSQTITNMIANAIYNGKRVLFVAEKKAALDVVHKRLKEIGLEPYCLELHSNKTNKQSFFQQLSRAKIERFSKLQEPGDPQTLREETEIYRKNLRKIKDTAEAVFKKRDHDLSVYDCISMHLSKKKHDLFLPYKDVADMSPTAISEICKGFGRLDIVEKLLGKHPAHSALAGLYLRDNSFENECELKDLLVKIPSSLDNARKKAMSRLNRWFVKKSAEDIFFADNLWKRLNEICNLYPEVNADLDSIESNVRKWGAGIGEIKKWLLYSEFANKVISRGLGKAVDYYLDSHTGTDTSEAIESEYYRRLACNAIENDENLRMFEGKLHDDLIQNYRTSVSSLTQLVRKDLVATMECRFMTGQTSLHKEQLAVLQTRMLNNGRGIALRTIISEATEFLRKAFPCMLMSPLSVAQYVKMEPGVFDLIIFDEASQIETADAVGTIARGRNIIIAGDPRQLPPTRFFSGRATTGEETEKKEDEDSILEECIALGIPSRHLSRHYRSRHESLIAFSNNAFYGNRLLTFPSCNDYQRKITHRNPHGIYDIGKTRTNAIEADAVVNYVIRMIEKASKPKSIGIVAFSQSQSNLIEDRLAEKLSGNYDLRSKMSKWEEPLFIKNLENVQGDERDIIIFSVGYGPDKDRNVSLNFGPVNQAGGERRLNVAITRARQEMVVFSSLMPYHIPKSKKLAKGAIALRDFLSYALDGIYPGTYTTRHAEERDAIAEDIAARLREKGYKVNTDIGRSSFRIDIGVIDSIRPYRYRLGIILDGKNYQSLPTVRDREVTTPDILQGLGWKLMHVWVQDWFKNPDQIIEDITQNL